MRVVSLLRQSLKFNRYIIKRTLSTPTQQVEEDVTLKHLTDNDNGISVLTLNSIQKRNTITADLLDSLNSTFDNVNKLDAKVLVIKSNVPKIFCAGADLKERLKMTEREVANFVNYIRFTVNRIQLLPMPVIAALDGSALGTLITCGLKVIVICRGWIGNGVGMRYSCSCQYCKIRPG
ncbi:hypothetical protein RI129_009752 [Pyrocoelia pectoralis]|uniref:Uncharacterized protein n=1 Tax=Pyrocoelia pectoralis TaxID=417401 RepID=A0AAN7V2T3_9COLE